MFDGDNAVPRRFRFYGEGWASFSKTKKDANHFCHYPHVLAGTGNDNRGMVDDALEEMGLSRDVQYKVANFSSAPHIVESSDAILTAPRKFVAMIADKFDITTFETPAELASYSMRIYWHLKNNDDRANKRLRDQIFHIASDESLQAIRHS